MRDLSDMWERCSNIPQMVYELLVPTEWNMLSTKYAISYKPSKALWFAGFFVDKIFQRDLRRRVQT